MKKANNSKSPLSPDSSKGAKRKQSSLESFFQSSSSAKKITKRSSSPIQIVDEETVSSVELKTDSTHAPSLKKTNTKNAFQLLLHGSKMLHKKIRAVFYLEFSENKFLPNFITDSVSIQNLMQEQTNHSYWTAEVNLTNFRWFLIPSGYREVCLTLLTNFNISTNTSPSGIEELKSIINAGLLKSMIQKGVRRRLALKVMNLSFQLLHDNAGELLRRMIIICLEDVLLHPMIPIIVWLMIATTKGFPLDLIFQYLCISFMHDLCTINYRDCYPPASSITEMINYIATLSEDVQYSQTSISQIPLPSSPSRSAIDPHPKSLYDLLPNFAWRTLIASLFLRASYGGMEFDRAMLEKYALLWLTRIMTLPIDIDDPPAQKSTDSFVSLFLHDQYLIDLQGPIQQASDQTSLNCLNTWGLELLRAYPLCLSNQLPVSMRADIQKRLLHLQKTRCFDFKPSQQLIWIYPSDDLILEGIDFHSDWNLLNQVYETSKDQLLQYFQQHSTIINLQDYEDISTTVQFEFTNDRSDFLHPEAVKDYLKNVIWVFRSSVNHHKLWPWLLTRATVLSPLTHYEELSSHEEYERNTLMKKSQLAGLWRIICPVINAYCDKKASQLAYSIQHNVPTLKK